LEEGEIMGQFGKPFFVSPIRRDKYSFKARRNSVIADPPAQNVKTSDQQDIFTLYYLFIVR